MKLRLSQYKETEGEYYHYCPGCEMMHAIPTMHRNSRGAVWSFSGDMEKPSFSPSINLDWKVCHYFITNGRIIYCGDCTHPLRGQTVELPEIPEGL